jgi:L-lysine exporter family protein LysE/ArgO
LLELIHHPLARGIVLGLGAAAPIGPVNVQIAGRALRRGFAAGFALGCGAVSVDVGYAIVSSLSFARVLTHPLAVKVVSGAGVALLAYLAVLCFRGAARDLRRDPLRAQPIEQPTHSAYFTGLLITALNPMTIAFWFTVVPAASAKAPRDAAGQLPWVCSGVFLGTIAWVVAFAGVLAWAGRFRKNWWLAAADAVGGATLLAFAGASFLRLLHSFL